MKTEQVYEPRCYAYGRASTAKQVDSPGTQKGIHKRYAEYNQLGEITATFMDVATSGKKPLAEREAGKALIKTLRRGDHVIVAKLDRMFRSAKDCAIMLDEFQRKGIRLHVCDLMGGALDLSSPIGMFVIRMLAAVAELERNYISQRTKEGLAAKKRVARKHTRFPGYGKKWIAGKDANGKPAKIAVRDDDEREVMQAIATWRMATPQSTWEEIETHLRKLGKITKEGKPWDQNRIRRSCKEEFRLQQGEQRGMR